MHDGRIFGVAWRTPLLASKTDSAVLAASGALISLAAAGAIVASQGGLAALEPQPTPSATMEAVGQPVAPPKIRSVSSSRALDLARQLKARGGRFYGAYWCSHCINQKETLGAEAMRLVPYIECDANGLNSRRSECTAAGVRGYPTWQLGGVNGEPVQVPSDTPLPSRSAPNLHQISTKSPPTLLVATLNTQTHGTPERPISPIVPVAHEPCTHS